MRLLLLLALLGPSLPARAAEPFLTSEQLASLERLFSPLEPQDPLHKGLPPEISRDYPEKEGFVEFEHVDGDKAPIGGGIKLSVPGMKVSDVFGDEGFARLPDGETLLRDTSRTPEVWQYPVGTRVMHRITLKSQPRRLFELRLAQKMPDGKWAFGIYKADEGAERLPLHLEGTPPLSFDVTIQGQLVHVGMYRLSPRSCRMCHFNHGHGGYQYPDQDHAGPCGFSPPNPHLLTDWAREYQARHGYFPFKTAQKLASR